MTQYREGPGIEPQPDHRFSVPELSSDLFFTPKCCVVDIWHFFEVFASSCGEAVAVRCREGLARSKIAPSEFEL